jgi:hypothetical protein
MRVMRFPPLAILTEGVDKLCDPEGLSRPSHRGWRPGRRITVISGKKKNALGNGSLGVLEHRQCPNGGGGRSTPGIREDRLFQGIFSHASPSCLSSCGPSCRASFPAACCLKACGEHAESMARQSSTQS